MIVYYISSHGFGHTVRACEVIRNLPREARVTARTDVPEWFIRRELAGRAIEIRPGSFDCGVLGPDSTSIDLARTIYDWSNSRKFWGKIRVIVPHSTRHYPTTLTFRQSEV